MSKTSRRSVKREVQVLHAARVFLIGGVPPPAPIRQESAPRPAAPLVGRGYAMSAAASVTGARHANRSHT
jgi:hypothetical protein